MNDTLNEKAMACESQIESEEGKSVLSAWQREILTVILRNQEKGVSARSFESPRCNGKPMFVRLFGRVI